MTTLKDLQTPYEQNWCPGCGNVAIWAAFKNAAVKEGWDDTNTTIVADIGCHGHIVNFVKITSLEGLHGRAVPVAAGIKMANHNLNVFVHIGDGGCLGEGGNHFIHACRRNHDYTVLLHDNAIYGLTTGQTSPASPHGHKTKSTPFGNPDHPLNPVALAIASGATFVARAFATDIPRLTELMIRANSHKGIAILDILQPCITFNKDYSLGFVQKNVYRLKDHDVTNKQAAFEKALEWGEKKIPLGVFYDIEQPSYESLLPQLKESTAIEHDPVRKDLENLFKEYA